MAIGYRITLGYNPNVTEGLAWAMLVDHARQLRLATEVLTIEALRLGAPAEDEEGVSIRDYAAGYAALGDGTLVIDDGERQIWQGASGGGLGRQIKEHLRRAFCRLLIERAHRDGVEVNLTVG